MPQQFYLAYAGGLLPGALVNARVKAVLSDGLLVTFLTYFTGTVDPFHLGQVRTVNHLSYLYRRNRKHRPS